MTHDSGPESEDGQSRDARNVPATNLSDHELLSEMNYVHRTRHDALRHAPTSALRTHLERTAELETEYLRRFPAREVDPARTR